MEPSSTRNEYCQASTRHTQHTAREEENVAKIDFGSLNVVPEYPPNYNVMK